MSAVGKQLKISASKDVLAAYDLANDSEETLSFSANNGTIFFNGKEYGSFCIDLTNIISNASNAVIQAALFGVTAANAETFIQKLINNNINIIINKSGFITSASLKFISNNITISFIQDYTIWTYVINVNATSGYSIGNNITSKVQISSSDVINTLTSSDSKKPLSAAQGKALNDKINTINDTLSAVYRPKGSKDTIAEVLALTDAKVGDVWNVNTDFTLGGQKYAAYTNVVCIVATSTTSHSDDNWDSLGGIIKDALTASDIVNVLNSTATNKALSAAQGKILNDKITALDDQINPLSLVVKGGTGSSGNTLASPRIVEKGTTLADTLTCTFTKGGTACAFKSLTVDGAAVTVSGTGNQLIQNITVTADKTVACVATDANGKSITTNYKYQFVDASYFGVVAADFANSPTAANITAILSTLTKSVKASKAYNTAAFNQNNQKCIYMYPSSFGALTKIVDGNNFDMTASFTKTTVTVNSISYLVYVLTSPSSVTNYTLKFS